ncbi:hypothetical protein A2U01_0067338, partial [Trifolium medium]|nr:hypothetical protein [Trifolium medium]
GKVTMMKKKLVIQGRKNSKFLPWVSGFCASHKDSLRVARVSGEGRNNFCQLRVAQVYWRVALVSC